MKRLKFGKLTEEGLVPTEKLQLHLTKEVYERTQTIKAWAETHVLPAAVVQTEYDVEQLSGGQAVPPPETVLLIPVGWQVTYRHETSKTGTVMRRLGIECLAEFAPPVACGVIMKLFGFVNPVMQSKMWMRSLGKGRYSVNFIEPVDGDWSAFPVRASEPERVLH